MKEKTFRKWIGKHKEKLIAGGIGIVVLTLSIILQRDDQINGVQTLSLPIEKDDDNTPCNVTPLLFHNMYEVDSERTSYTVSEHIRNLPSGWHASSEKRLSASEHGYILGPEQTWVESYRKGVS